MKTINSNAPVKCSKIISINSKKDKVWTALTDIDNWCNWQHEIAESKLHGELKAGSTFDWTSGGVRIHSILHTVEPNNSLGWTGKTFGISAIHNWKLVESNGKTEVSVEESMEGLPARIFKKSFNKSLENGMQTWLESLKKKCES